MWIGDVLHQKSALGSWDELPNEVAHAHAFMAELASLELLV